MQFSSSFIIAALPFLAAAQPLQARDDASKAYTLTAIHSGDQDVHNQPIKAANNAFFIGNGIGSAGTDTSIFVANSIASLNVDVPGGQQIFVTSTGALSYTAPHSRTMPSGSTSTGFTTDGSSTSDSVANLIVNGIGSKGWLACPYADGKGFQGYEIFANITNVQVSGTSITHCHDIAIALEPETNAGASAHQYS